MSHRHGESHVNAMLPTSEEIALRLLERIRAELLEIGAGFGIDDDLFHAGLDSMAIMQVIMILEEEFGAKLPDRLIKRETFATARAVAGAVIAHRENP